MIRVLLADEDQDFRHRTMLALRALNYEVQECAAGPEFEEHAQAGGWDVVVASLRLPKWSEPGRRSAILPRLRGSIVLVLAEAGAEQEATTLVREGAQGYLLKPVWVEELLRSVRRSLETRSALDASPGAPGGEMKGDVLESFLPGKSPCMAQLRKVIARVARSDSNVLITGETGTGKDLVARALHLGSSRRNRPFVVVNCGALPATLLEGQLFGHRKGAFTGADRDRAGLLEMAKQGTLLLDEIGEMPLALQPKLLRALESREFWPLGSDASLPFDGRILAATNRDLKMLTAKGDFREDLYFRISSVEIPVPALRERPEDIPTIAPILLARLAAPMNRVAPALSPAALMALEHYHWPGNVRELANTLERAMILNDGPVLESTDFPSQVSDEERPPGGTLRSARRAFERLYVERVVKSCNGDKAKAARTLGIGIASVYRKLGFSTPARKGRRAT